MNEKVGIIGTGRLGSALAKRLAPHCSLLLSDSFLGKARQMAKILNADFGNIRYLFEKADIILLAIPPEEICLLIEKEETFLRQGAILVNLATSLDTHKIRTCLTRKDIRVIGIKPITQAYALAHGYQTIFVTSCEDTGLREKLVPLLREIGEIVLGDDMLVKEINAEATRWEILVDAGHRSAVQHNGLCDSTRIPAWDVSHSALCDGKAHRRSRGYDERERAAFDLRRHGGFGPSTDSG